MERVNEREREKIERVSNIIKRHMFVYLTRVKKATMHTADAIDRDRDYGGRRGGVEE